MKLVEYFADWLRAFSRRYRVIQRYRWKLDAAQQALSLAEMERDSLQRQLTAAIDTVQAFGLHNRTIGMMEKVDQAAIIKATQP